MAAFATTAPRLALYLELIRWDRPAGWLLLLWPTLSALWIAADGFPGWHLVLVFVAGTVLMRSAGCCVNDVADRNYDRHVKRTAERPVTSGRISVREALALAPCSRWRRCAGAHDQPAHGVAVVRRAGDHPRVPVCQAWAVDAAGGAGVAFSFGIPMAFAAVLGARDWSPLSVPDAVPPQAWWLLVGNAFWCWPMTPSMRWSIATTTCGSHEDIGHHAGAP